MNARLKYLLENVDGFGVMHIVVEDGNMDDGNLYFVETEMAKHGASDDERELLALLRTMTVEEREDAWDELIDG